MGSSDFKADGPLRFSTNNEHYQATPESKPNNMRRMANEPNTLSCTSDQEQTDEMLLGAELIPCRVVKPFIQVISKQAAEHPDIPPKSEVDAGICPVHVKVTDRLFRKDRPRQDQSPQPKRWPKLDRVPNPKSA